MMDYEDIVQFHGHECPGLAIGYRMALAGMKALEASHSEDEEIIAIVENNACGVDALQCVSGCTFGKGNLFFRDYGKQVYILFSRSTGKGVRVLFHGKGIPPDILKDRDSLLQYILKSSQEELLTVTTVEIDEPVPARIQSSVNCAICGEKVMETRLRNVSGRKICIPCASIEDR